MQNKQNPRELFWRNLINLIFSWVLLTPRCLFSIENFSWALFVYFHSISSCFYSILIPESSCWQWVLTFALRFQNGMLVRVALLWFCDVLTFVLGFQNGMLVRVTFYDFWDWKDISSVKMAVLGRRDLKSIGFINLSQSSGSAMRA